VKLISPSFSASSGSAEYRASSSIEDTALGDSELRATLSHAIQSLPPGYRTVFVLHDIEGLTHNEVAAALSLSIRNSRTRLQRARVKLEDLIAASSPEVAARWIEYKNRNARK
jgi:RNA polymerase sigma factor (sigma-70 family)